MLLKCSATSHMGRHVQVCPKKSVQPTIVSINYSLFVFADIGNDENL